MVKTGKPIKESLLSLFFPLYSSLLLIRKLCGVPLGVKHFPILQLQRSISVTQPMQMMYIFFWRLDTDGSLRRKAINEVEKQNTLSSYMTFLRRSLSEFQLKNYPITLNWKVWKLQSSYDQYFNALECSIANWNYSLQSTCIFNYSWGR